MLNRRLRTRANLIELYWSALRRQRTTEPPSGLDDETVGLIVQLDRHLAPGDASTTFVDQLWQRIAVVSEPTTSHTWQEPALDPTRHRGRSSQANDTTEEQPTMADQSTSPPEPLVIPPRQWSRELLKFAAAAIVFIIVGAILVLALRDNDDQTPAVGPSGPTPTPTVETTATSVAVVPTATAEMTVTTEPTPTVTAQPSPTVSLPSFGTVVATIEVGESPRQYAAGAGALWVTNADDGTVSRIDLATNTVVATIQVVPPDQFVTGVDGATQVDAIAVDDSAVWVSALNSSVLVRIDPATNQVVERYRLPAGIHGLTVGGGALWGRSWTSNQILRIDPATGAVVALIPVEFPASAVYLADALWVQRPGEVVKIDPVTNTIVTSVTYADTAGDPSAPRRMMVASGGSLWMSSDSWHEVLQIDPATATVAGTVALPFAIDTIVIAGSDDALWACPCFGNQNEQIWQLDPAAGEWTAVQTVPFVVGIGYDGGALWSFGSRGEIIRIDLTS